MKHEKLANKLHSASIRLLRGLRRTDAESGVGPARLSALSVLVYAGPRTLGQLADIEQVAAPTMSRVVRGLEEQGLTARRANPEDGRSITLHATRKGRTLLERARQARLATLSDQLARLSASERRTLGDAAIIIADLARPAE